MNEERITEPNIFDQADIESMSVMGLLRFGSGALLKHAITNEITEHLGRKRYHRLEENQEFRGYRNGYQKTRVDTPIGQLEYDRPKVAHAPEFKSQFHTPHVRRPQEFASAIADMYINGVSTRKVKDSLKAVTGKKVKLTKSTVSRITKKLKIEFNEWKTRSLAEFNIAYLYLDAIRVGMRMGGTNKDAVLIAYGITPDGSWEVLSIDIAVGKRLANDFLNSFKNNLAC